MITIGSCRRRGLRRGSDARCQMLDIGCWMLDSGCWILDSGCERNHVNVLKRNHYDRARSHPLSRISYRININEVSFDKLSLTK
jgi:hypothetical protein